MKRGGRSYRPFPLKRKVREVKMEKYDSLQYLWYREKVLRSRLNCLT